MGTHPIFESDFDCLTDDVMRMNFSWEYALPTNFAPFLILISSAAYIQTSHVVFIILSFVGVFLFLYSLQDALLYQANFPSQARNYHPKPNSPHEVVNFGPRQRLNGILLKCESGNCPTIVFCHGNAGNCSNRGQIAEVMRSLLKVNIFVFDYSGYGASRGRPSERNLYTDSQNAIDYITSRSDLRGDVILFGRSLGGAVVIELATRPENEHIKAVIVENTFTSVPLIGMSVFPFLAPVIKLLPTFAVKNKFLSIEKIDKITIPTLLISGRDDDLVPPQMMDQLFSLCKAPKKKYVKLRGNHNTTWTTAGYFDQLKLFINTLHLETVKPCSLD